MTSLEQFDIRNFIDRLTPKKGKHRYVCPVCEGSLTIDPKSGKYHCWGQECASSDIREAIRPWAEVIGGTVLHPPYINKKLQRVEQTPKLPAAAPIPKGEIALSTLPHSVSPPKKVARGRNFEITYPYSPNQWVLRIEKSDGSKITIPHHRTADGEVAKGKGDETWHPYRIDEIRSFGTGKWILGNEGEKCVDITRSVLQLVSFTFQGGSWSDELLLLGLQEIKDCGVLGVVYFPDNDEPGRKKAQKLAIAAAKIQLPFIEIDPLRLWPQCPPGGDIADWVAAKVIPIEEGRRQKAEGRREDCRGILTHQQFVSAKTKFSGGLKPKCEEGNRATQPIKQTPASCLLPSASLAQRVNELLQALNTEIALCRDTVVVTNEVAQETEDFWQKDPKAQYEIQRQHVAKFNLTRTAQISIENGFLPSIQLKSIPPGIIGIKGDWGIGKSFLLSAWCRQWPHKIIQVAHLNALLSNTAPKFDCFHHHELKDLQLGVTSAPRLAITDISLAAMFDPQRWTKDEPFILILDEIEQVLRSIQTNSNLKGTLRVKARVKLEWLIKNAVYVIGSDRDLCDETLNYIEQVRGDSHPAFIIYHKGKKGINRQPIVFNCNKYKDEVLTRLINAAKAGHNIIIPCENKTDLLAIEQQLLSAGIPDNSMFFAHGDNSNEPGIKELIQKADEIYPDYQILGYTMTMGTALSFEKSHFEKCYAFFSGDVLSASDQAQMLFRYRLECEITVWINPKRRRLEINQDILLSDLLKNVQDTDKLIVSIDQIGPLIEQGILPTTKGDISPDDLPWIQHKLGIIARANASIANPSSTLHDLLVNAGFTLKIESNDKPLTTNEGNCYLEQKQQIKSAQDQAIAQAELMSEAEFMKAMINNGNLNRAERNRLEKTRLHRDTGLEITEDIVKLQRTKNLTRGAKMLKILLGDEQTAVAYDLTDRQYNPDIGDQSFYAAKRQLLHELGIPEIIEKLVQGWRYTNNSSEVVAVADLAREHRNSIKRLLGFTVSLEKSENGAFKVSNSAILGLILDTLCIERESTKTRKRGHVYQLNRQHWEMLQAIMAHIDKLAPTPTLAGVIEKALAAAVQNSDLHQEHLTPAQTAPTPEILSTVLPSAFDSVPHPHSISYIYKNNLGMEHPIKPNNHESLHNNEIQTGNQSKLWTGLKLKLQQGLEDAGEFYQQLVDKIGESVGVAEGEPFWNGYLGQWQVAVNFVNGCKSVMCDWLVTTVG
ncbi:hypothetical protein H6G74_16920 [Nostoc spongiaeforme FACHB-130]|uniref:Uncharacterized protein n=1 Tax=Nostoc spongiaeforme FACHB-130 TaxID=1357510 RepID=A0ABR8FY06_9NOSO|nr:plasmid replication protein, CyRepA1 family [Nostoc spongiaeforme]MBD2595998.1 hypothetical protein [Nostoc spongiaeforme FACHB-130]